MAKERPPPTIPVRPHTYIPDVAAPTDWRGERSCMGCHLPKENRVHDYKAPKHDTDRIIGESGE